MEQRYPAEHCVLIDDKLRIFSDVKIIWDSRVTMVFHRQGHYALDPHVEARFSPADATITRIGDLLNDDLSALPLGKGVVLYSPALYFSLTSGTDGAAY